MQKIPLVVIAGPTAVGKSELAIELAHKFGMEILSADSMQLYRGMDIGSAKPSPEERNLVTHHLIDIRDPDEDFSAVEFQDEARKIIFSRVQQGKSIMVVGGTGFYIRALTQGLFPAPGADPQLRAKLREKEQAHGKGYLHRELEQKDPDAAAALHPHDLFRIIRAFEVLHLTGEPISQQQKRHRFKDSPFELLKIGLMRDREELYLRIEQRVDKMISLGLIDEITRLLDRKYPPSIKPFESLGYKQILSHLRGEVSLDDAIHQIKRNTKRYAKRQLTWFRNDGEISWFTLPAQADMVSDAIKKFLKI